MKSASHLVEAQLTVDGVRNLLTRHDLAVIGFITSKAPASEQKHGINSNPYSTTTQLNTVTQCIPVTPTLLTKLDNKPGPLPCKLEECLNSLAHLSSLQTGNHASRPVKNVDRLTT